MYLSLRPLVFGAAAVIFVSFSNIIKPDNPKPIEPPVYTKLKPSPKIQVAVLLDVSNSMDGLIEQAKAQLWNMVSVMGKAKCEGVAPQIEIALYEYGRDNNDPALGFIKQISPFTTDLDILSQNLFKLTTYGGSEFCGQVIHTSLNELKWDSASSSYKVIFIAGNEDFLQGNVTYNKACEEAKKKGVIVNTIYCGDRMQGIRENWNLGAECGNGSYTNINSNARIEEIATPYDTTLIVLNGKLNGTYLYFGDDGKERGELQKTMDESNAGYSRGVAAKRAAVKGNRSLYDNSSWDLVDAYEKDKSIIQKVDMKTLPDSLKNLSRKQLEVIVDNNNKQRSAIQKEIATANVQRESFIATERAKAAGANNTATLETEVEKIIKEQVTRYNMVIK
jgi:hypothetical protein